MHEIFFVAAIGASAAVLSLMPAIADNSMPTPMVAGAALTGKMATWQNLVGSWSCTVKIAAMAGEPAFTDTGVVAYTVVPGNALHAHVTAKDYASDYYVGFVDKTKLFWMNTVDAYGNVGGERSVDGKIFAGSSMVGGAKMLVRDTLTRPTPDTTRDLQEYQTKGAWNMASDSSCTRL